VSDRNSRRPPGPMPLGGAIMRRLSQVGPPPCSAIPKTAYFPHVREAALPTDLSPMEGKQESRRRLVRRVYAVREAARRAPVRYPLWLLLTPAASIAVWFKPAAERFGPERGQARKIFASRPSPSFDPPETTLTWNDVSTHLSTVSRDITSVPPAGFEPALPPPEGETGRGWLILVGVAKCSSAP
jgi:hypothetical protein